MSPAQNYANPSFYISIVLNLRKAVSSHLSRKEVVLVYLPPPRSGEVGRGSGREGAFRESRRAGKPSPAAETATSPASGRGDSH